MRAILCEGRQFSLKISRRFLLYYYMSQFSSFLFSLSLYRSLFLSILEIIAHRFIIESLLAHQSPYAERVCVFVYLPFLSRDIFFL